MPESENFFDHLIARAPRKAGAAFLALGLTLIGFVIWELSSVDPPNEYAVIIGPACLVNGLWLLLRGRCPQWEQTVAAAIGLGLGCWTLYDLKSPQSLILGLF